jgi:hypothetical protein
MGISICTSATWTAMRTGSFAAGGRFTDVAESAGVAWGGRAPKEPTNGTVRPCAGDVNGDGRLDLFMANYGRNGLFFGRPDGTFDDAGEVARIAIDARTTPARSPTSTTMADWICSSTAR